RRRLRPEAGRVRPDPPPRERAPPLPDGVLIVRYGQAWPQTFTPPGHVVGVAPPAHVRLQTDVCMQVALHAPSHVALHCALPLQLIVDPSARTMCVIDELAAVTVHGPVQVSLPTPVPLHAIVDPAPMSKVAVEPL